MSMNFCAPLGTGCVPWVAFPLGVPAPAVRHPVGAPFFCCGRCWAAWASAAARCFASASAAARLNRSFACSCTASGKKKVNSRNKSG